MNLRNFFLLFFVTSCTQNPGQSGKTQSSDTIRYDSTTDFSKFRYVESFNGILACADCPGILTEITFVNDNLTYHESNSYLDRNITNKISGSYTTERGYKTDDDATVYVLDDDKRGHERRFLKLKDSTLLILDQNGEIIDSNAHHRLFRIK